MKYEKNRVYLKMISA